MRHLTLNFVINISNLSTLQYVWLHHKVPRHRVIIKDLLPYGLIRRIQAANDQRRARGDHRPDG